MARKVTAWASLPVTNSVRKSPKVPLDQRDMAVMTLRHCPASRSGAVVIGLGFRMRRQGAVVETSFSNPNLRRFPPEGSQRPLDRPKRGKCPLPGLVGQSDCPHAGSFRGLQQ